MEDTKAAMTLDRTLSRLGIASRTEARKAIQAGRLKVNGHVVRDPDRWVRAGKDVIHLDGVRLRPERRVYLLFYKPKGVITSHGDPDCRKTIYDCLDAAIPWVFPVGRLDKDSSGLLLLTNDTGFANLVTSPDSGIPKTYLVKLNGLIDETSLKKMADGVVMKRGDCAQPASVRKLEDRGKYSRLEVVLTEGKNREVRRIMEAVGFKVLKLVRTRIGNLDMDGLTVGQYRELSKSEVASFRSRRATEPSGSKSGTRRIDGP